MISLLPCAGEEGISLRNYQIIVSWSSPNDSWIKHNMDASFYMNLKKVELCFFIEMLRLLVCLQDITLYRMKDVTTMNLKVVK